MSHGPLLERLAIPAIHRKMLRELWRLRGQLLSIGLVVATAIVTIVTLRGTYEALYEARADYYRTYRLADVWSSLERAPESLRDRIAGIPGVTAVSTRVSGYATLDLPWLTAPGMGLFVSVPERGRPELNDVHVTRGRYVAPGRAAEVVASENFFAANDLELGDTIRAVLNGLRHDLIIVGVAISPEHSYSVPPGALYPEDERYGVFWMSRSVLGPNLDARDAFNEIAVSLSAGANRGAVIRQMDRLLDPYGGLGAYGREDQLSYKILNDELTQNRTMGTVVPAIFLGVAAFLLNLVLSRLVATQRTEIGTLRAFGYTDREVGWHYMSYAMVAVALGTLLGAGGGVWAGGGMVTLYTQYFKFPDLTYRLSWTLVALGSGVSLLAALLGGWSAVRSAASLSPAEAMRPEAPARFRHGLLERIGLGRLLGTGGRMILRNMERRPVRSLLSSLGVAFSVAILVVGMFMFDGVTLMMDLQFRVAQREDLSVSFNQPRGERALYDLRRVAGVTRVEAYHSVPVRLRSAHREREVAVTGMNTDARLRRIVDQDGRIHPLPLEGLLLSSTLADALRIGQGDRVTVEMLTGLRRTEEVVVAGVVDDLLGVSAYMTLESLYRLTRQSRLVSGAYLLTDATREDLVNEQLKAAPAVASVVSPQTMFETFQSQLQDSLYISIGFMLAFASIISVAVIYNGTRIALSERGRELASLRVLGFTRREIATLLFGEQAVITLLAIPIGSVIGYGLAAALVASFASETYRIPMVVSTRTYLFAATAAISAAIASGLLVRRRLNSLDLVAVLKTRE